MISDSKEADLYESSDDRIDYEETNAELVEQSKIRASNKHISGFWTVPDDGFNLYERTNNDRFADFVERIIIFFTNSIDNCRIFLYNVYCKYKHQERANTVKKTNDKTTSETNTNGRKWYQVNWGAVGRGIMGLGLFLLVASEIFSVAVIVYGTGQELIPKVMVAPIALHAFIILVKVFTAFTRKGDK